MVVNYSFSSSIYYDVRLCCRHEVESSAVKFQWTALCTENRSHNFRGKKSSRQSRVGRVCFALLAFGNAFTVKG